MDDFEEFARRILGPDVSEEDLERFIKLARPAFDYGAARADAGRMLGCYVLVGQTPVPEPDARKWAFWMESADRQVGRDEIGPALVSTVFLGLDHDHLRQGAPILFETMVFADGSDIDREMARCSTWLEAEAQHKSMVEYVRAFYAASGGSTSDAETPPPASDPPEK